MLITGNAHYALQTIWVMLERDAKKKTICTSSYRKHSQSEGPPFYYLCREYKTTRTLGYVDRTYERQLFPSRRVATQKIIVAVSTTLYSRSRHPQFWMTGRLKLSERLSFHRSTVCISEWTGFIKLSRGRNPSKQKAARSTPTFLPGGKKKLIHI